MYYLLSNEYARIWEEEHKAYDQVQHPHHDPSQTNVGAIKFNDIFKKKYMLQGKRVKRISFRTPVPPDVL
ncbi:hypothetical protein L9F63_010385 [Diploptera punctata]|uniref:Uncharacterized protein n=1 Tax=Diploptera punctata TaxID=6984 RepID=A0AAD8AJ39_DIPPU|nr:hypothetical protein L9F63_010385 [Diploptera punctata]